MTVKRFLSHQMLDAAGVKMEATFDGYILHFERTRQPLAMDLFNHPSLANLTEAQIAGLLEKWDLELEQLEIANVFSRAIDPDPKATERQTPVNGKTPRPAKKLLDPVLVEELNQSVVGY